MTHVQYVNCSKWKKVLGISLWVGATIGLASGIYGLISYTTFEPGLSCFTQQYIDVETDKIEHNRLCYTDGGGTLGLLYGIALIGNGVNTFFIWFVINNHYKFIEIRCGVKPSPNEVKQE